jgi:hypothetical protein
MESSEVCLEFAALTGEIERTVYDLQEGVDDLVSSYTQPESRQAREISSLQFENHLLKGEITNEEQWMKRIAFDILDSEQGTLIIAMRAIWLLSENSCNAIEIIRSKPVMTSMIDLLCSETSAELIQACFGVLGNLCQTAETRKLFVETYDTELVLRLLHAGRQVISSAVDPFSKTFELALILMHNFSLHEGVADLMRQNDFTAVLILALDKSHDNTNLFDATIATLNTLYRSESDLASLAAEAAETIIRLVGGRQPTCATIQLMTTVRIAD